MLMYIKHNDTVLTQPITQLMDWVGSGHTQWTHDNCAAATVIRPKCTKSYRFIRGRKQKRSLYPVTLTLVFEYDLPKPPH